MMGARRSGVMAKGGRGGAKGGRRLTSQGAAWLGKGRRLACPGEAYGALGEWHGQRGRGRSGAGRPKGVASRKGRATVRLLCMPGKGKAWDGGGKAIFWQKRMIEWVAVARAMRSAAALGIRRGRAKAADGGAVCRRGMAHRGWLELA